MASGVTLPTFFDEEILLYQKLNAAMDAIDAKFTAGIGTADLAWPLTAEGNIDMSIFNITGGRQIWGYVNAANYDTLEDALTAAGSGGVVLVPPETTITTAGGEAFSGSGAAVIGAGPSSVLKFTDTPTSGYLLRSSSGTGLVYANLTFDGNLEAGTGQIGLDLQGVTNATISCVNFRNFSGASVKISASCNGVKIDSCAFNGGATEHIFATHAGQLVISNCTSDSAGTVAIRLEPSGASATVETSLANVHIIDPGTYGIQAAGYGTSASSSPGSLFVVTTLVEGSGSAIGVQAGTASALMKSFSWSGGRVQAGATGGMLVNAGGGSICTEVHTASPYCIDLDESEYVTVVDCVLRDGTVGVDCSDSDLTGCVVHDNKFVNCTKDVALGENNLVQYNNGVLFGIPGVSAYSNMTAEAISADTSGAYCAITIPANTLEAGDIITFRAQLQGSGNETQNSYWVRFAGDNISGGSWFGNGQENYASGSMVILTSTTADSLWASVAENDLRDHYNGISNLIGLDLTVEISVDVYVTSTDGVTGSVRGLILTIQRGENQGA